MFTQIRPQTRQYLLALCLFTLSATLIIYPLLFFSGQKTAGYDVFTYNWNYWWMRYALSTPHLNIYLT
ncbi:MAG: hypothetical protein CUN52_13505, partial [Phototrophicales bacterium]